jgi:hypothetical protein
MASARASVGALSGAQLEPRGRRAVAQRGAQHVLASALASVGALRVEAQRDAQHVKAERFRPDSQRGRR